MMLGEETAKRLLKGGDVVYCITDEKEGRGDFVAIEIDGEAKMINTSRSDATRRLKSIENILPDYRLNVCSYTLHGFLEARQALSEHECSVSIETKRKIGKGSVVHIGKGGKTHDEGKL